MTFFVFAQQLCILLSLSLAGISFIRLPILQPQSIKDRDAQSIPTSPIFSFYALVSVLAPLGDVSPPRASWHQRYARSLQARSQPETRCRFRTNIPIILRPVWTTLITNTAYLSGLLTLEYSLRKAGSKYPLVALYTDTFPEEGHAALDARGISKKRVPYLLPSIPKDYTNDTRFYDCWSKLTPFSLVEYDRVVQLDSDMLVLKNMDELMELELDAPELAGTGNKVFAASHACVCNPLKKSHYPKNW